MTAGRDLTAQDVRSAVISSPIRNEVDWEKVAGLLNRIARAGDDEPRGLGARFTEMLNRHGSRLSDTAGQDEPVVCDLCGCNHRHNDAGVVEGPRGCVLCRWCFGSPGVSRDAPSAAPAVDTAAPDDPRIPILVEALGDYAWSRRLAPHLLARLDVVAAPDPLRAPVEVLLAALDAGQRGRLPASIADAVAEVRRHLDGPAQDGGA